MKMEKIEYRAYIKTRALLGTQATDIHNELVIVWGDSVPSYRTVAMWAARYKSGRETLEDDPHSDRPITECTTANIERVKQLLH